MGVQTYLQRFDGQAVTIEDFVSTLESVSEKDLQQFRYWYSQAGTPRLKVEEQHDAENGVYELTVRQHVKPTPGQPEKVTTVGTSIFAARRTV